MKKILFAFACIYLIWGSTFLAVRYALESFPPLAMSGARFGLAGLILYRFSRQPLPGWRHWRSAAVVGTLMLGAGTGLVAWGQQTVTSGQAALLIATTPLWTALWAFFRQGYPGHPTLAGIILSTLGVFALVGSAGSLTTGTLAILLASLSWTLASILSASLEKPASNFQFAAMTMISAGAFLGALSWLTGEEMSGPVTLRSTLSWVYLVIAGSLVGFTAYTWLLRKVSPTLVATHTYVNPLVAMALSAMAGEAIPTSTPAALTLVLAGLVCMSVKEVPVLPERIFRTWIPMIGHGHCR